VYIPEQHYLWDFWLVSPQEWKRDSLYHLFYTALSHAEKAPVQRIGLTISTDLQHWERYTGNPLLEVDTRWYEQQGTERWEEQSWRDPYLVFSADEQIYYMFLSARANSGPLDGRGVIGLARSADLLSWEVLPPGCLGQEARTG
jgi:beta-fructofuranosidase